MSDDDQTWPLKHGLLARAVVIDSRISAVDKEDPEELRAILTDLIADHKPRGVLEEMQVELIAVCYWQQRRLLWPESAEIADQVNRATSQALEATQRLDDEAGELRDRADTIRRTRKLPKEERDLAKGYFNRPNVKPEEWAEVLERFACIDDLDVDRRYHRMVQRHSGPEVDGRLEARLRCLSVLTDQANKAIRMLQKLQSVRRARDGRSGRRGRPPGSRSTTAGLRLVK